MRLIDVHTYKLEYFDEQSRPEYAILSHRWEEDEVTFDDLKDLTRARTKKGFYKIEGCCNTAQAKSLHHVWIDTCCINKDSSAELSEAINSMFRWYQNAKLCFVYLHDVGTNGPEIRQQFISSVWFQRGWTLQELLAPATVFFYNKAWLRFGSRAGMADEISQASSIQKEILLGTKTIDDYSIYQRMHWSARRQTTRVEDRAYSLMGIFNVNMPLLYGEGEKAFIRLQEEIIKYSDDMSIFAWNGIQPEGQGLLALQPEAFADAVHFRAIGSGPHEDLIPYLMTNRGLSIRLVMMPWATDVYLALLDCEIGDLSNGGWHMVGIFLRHIRGQEYRRVRVPHWDDIFVSNITMLHSGLRDTQSRLIYVRQERLPSSVSRAGKVDSPFPLTMKIHRPAGGQISSPAGDWDPNTGMAKLAIGSCGILAFLDLRDAPGIATYFDFIALRYAHDCQPELLAGHVDLNPSDDDAQWQDNIIQQWKRILDKIAPSTENHSKGTQITTDRADTKSPGCPSVTIDESAPLIWRYHVPKTMESVNVVIQPLDRDGRWHNYTIKMEKVFRKGQKMWEVTFVFK